MSAVHDVVGGRYRLLEVIGAGGMGRVWLADDELLRRRVAVKEIATPADAGPAQLLDAQLITMREARAAARLEHPGVVGIYDVVWRPDRSWIVMEYVESRSLDEVVRESGPLPHREVARIGLGVLDALRAAHAAGVLHRDVKPHNVLLATDGRVLLTDFGLALVKGVEQSPGPLRGSPYFVAPERLSGVEAGEAGDLWSLGATLYAAVEGRAPFQKATVAASLTALATEPPAPARHSGPLTPIIAQLLTKDPDRRLTAADAQARLRRVLSRAVGVFPMRVTPPHTPAGTSTLGMSMILDRLPGNPPRERLARGTRVALLAAAIALVGTTGTALALGARPGSLAYWQEQEESAVATGLVPGYQRVTLAALPSQQGGAEWEFTWQPGGEPVRRHERGVLLPAGAGRAFLVEWTVPEPDWVADEPYLRLVLASLS